MSIADAAFSKRIDIGRFEIIRAVATDIADAQVVRENENDIRWRRFFGGERIQRDQS